mgnify:CR=1 FL=1
MKIFPYTLIRVAGGPVQDLCSMELRDAGELLTRYIAAQKQLRMISENLGELLYKAIPEVSACNARRELISVRRAIYHHRMPEIGVVPQCRFAADIEHLLAGYREIFRIVETLRHRGEQMLQNDYEQSRQRLYSLAENEKLRKGLLLSSNSLLSNIDTYLLSGRGERNKKTQQAETGLLKYVTRMYAKTSPFSTFTSLAAGRLSENDACTLVPEEGETGGIVSHIRLNNYLYAYLKELLIRVPEVSVHLPVRLNPSVRKDGENYCFLTNHHNTESFQRIPLHPLRELITELIHTADKPVSVRQLSGILVQEHLDASLEEAGDYLLQLLGYGFLEWNIPVSGTDPDWDISLSRFFRDSGIDQPVVRELTDLLGQMRKAAEEYAEASPEQRKGIQAETYQAFRSYCTQMLDRLKEDVVAKDVTDTGDAAFRKITSLDFQYTPEHLFYEDTTWKQPFQIAGPRVRPLIGQLEKLLHTLKRFEVQRRGKERMYRYFLQKYGKEDTIPLLTFYESYCKDVEIPARNKHTGSIEGLNEAAEQRDRMNEVWSRYLAEHAVVRSPDSFHEVHIRQEDLAEADRLFPDKYSDREATSLGAFLQLYEDKTDEGSPIVKAVVNATFPGYGKLTGRFLHLFPAEITEQLRIWNSRIGAGSLMAENTDASYFNANLHPPLLEYEIAVPEGHGNLSGEKQLQAGDILVTADQEQQALKLIHASSGQVVRIFDLGLQNINTRSPFFQLLERFSPAAYIYTTPLTRAINLHLYENRELTDVLVVPRIVYEDTLILQRKSWKIAQKALPHRNSQEPDWDYLARLEEWRQLHAIPEEVFAAVTTSAEYATLSVEEKRNIGKDDYKPQYISFKNPLLIGLFEKMLRKVPRFLVLSEMLPASRQLLSPDGKEQYVTEFVFQWYEE